ncbi:MAG: hypothetical protein OXU79_01590 [Gemmatimonadota bacterium]|nr:hypothetical protein [Gemmatimonadota bacterium]
MSTLAQTDVESAAIDWRSCIGCQVVHECGMAYLRALTILMNTLHPRLVNGVTL